jgi:hypothetical protein
MHGYDVSRVELNLRQSNFFEISRKLWRAGLDTVRRLDGGGRMCRTRAGGVVTNDRRMSEIGDKYAGTLIVAFIGRGSPWHGRGLADMFEQALSRCLLAAGPEIRK